MLLLWTQFAAALSNLWVIKAHGCRPTHASTAALLALLGMKQAIVSHTDWLQPSRSWPQVLVLVAVAVSLGPICLHELHVELLELVHKA
jgi:hypothetical protein